MTTPVDPALLATLRAALGLLLASAALHKLRDLAAFRAVLAEYRVLPRVALAVAALLVPLCEGAAALALLAPAAPAPRALGPAAAAALFTVYAAAIGANLARGRRDLDCGCVGPSLRQPLSPALLARNAALVAAALVCLLPAAPRTLVWLDAVTVAAATASLALFWVAAHRALAQGPALAALRVTP